MIVRVCGERTRIEGRELSCVQAPHPASMPHLAKLNATHGLVWNTVTGAARVVPVSPAKPDNSKVKIICGTVLGVLALCGGIASYIAHEVASAAQHMKATHSTGMPPILAGLFGLIGLMFVFAGLRALTRRSVTVTTTIKM